MRDILIQELESQFEKEGLNKLNVINKIVNVYERENNTLELEMTYEVITNIGEERKIK